MIKAETTATYDEIITQPGAWFQAIESVSHISAQLQDLAKQKKLDRVLLTGCGSTFYLAHAIAALFAEFSGVPALAVPGGELWLNPRNAYPIEANALLVAFSRSGTTSETVAAARRFQQESGGTIIAVTNDPRSDLACLADICIGIPKGQERSIAQTRSFASMYVAGVALTFTFTGQVSKLAEINMLPAIAHRLISTSDHLVRSVAEDLSLDRFYFLGSGPRYGLACEANLKMKEMSLTHSEPFHFLEFRHGPMSMVGDSTCIIGLLSDPNYKYEIAVLEEMQARGASVFTLGEQGADICFSSNLTESVRNALYLPPLQLMALYRSLAKGLNPDQPENLTAVIKLEID